MNTEMKRIIKQREIEALNRKIEKWSHKESVPTDEIYVYSACCTWHGSIHETRSHDGIPCCPHCGSPRSIAALQFQSFRGVRDGKHVPAREAKLYLLDHLSQGHLQIPVGPMCEGFSYEEGYPGHERD